MAKICSDKKFQSNRTSSSRDMWGKSQKKREKERVLKMTKNSRKIDHYSENTGTNELEFRLVLGFRHRMPHKISTWLLKVSITVICVTCKVILWRASSCTFLRHFSGFFYKVMYCSCNSFKDSVWNIVYTCIVSHSRAFWMHKFSMNYVVIQKTDFFCMIWNWNGGRSSTIF